jgi:hypothetical protein
MTRHHGQQPGAGEMTAEESLAQAGEARRAEEAKHDAERPVREKLARIGRENDVARLLRAALGGRA